MKEKGTTRKARGEEKSLLELEITETRINIKVAGREFSGNYLVISGRGVIYLWQGEDLPYWEDLNNLI